MRWGRKTFNFNKLANPGKVFPLPELVEKQLMQNWECLRELNYIRGLYS